MFFFSFTVHAQEKTEDSVSIFGTQSDIEESYLIYKIAAMEATASYYKKYNQSDLTFGRCTYKNFMDEVGYDGSALAHLAMSTAWVRVRLNNLGYPKETYEPLMKSYEKYFIKYLLNEAGHPSSINEVVRQIENKRKINNPELPELTFVDGCEPPRDEFAHLRSDPSDGKVNYISSFEFELCKAKSLNPWDITECNGWSESDSKRALPFYGVYIYQVSWPNGISGRGKKRILGTHPDKAKIYTVTKGNSF